MGHPVPKQGGFVVCCKLSSVRKVITLTVVLHLVSTAGLGVPEEECSLLMTYAKGNLRPIMIDGSDI